MVSGIVVGDGRRSGHLMAGLNVRILLLILVCALVLAGAAGVTYVMLVPHDAKTPVRTNNNSELSARGQADKLSYEGDEPAAQKVLDVAAKAATTKEAKASIYIQQAVLAMNAKKYDDAMKYARLADTATPTSNTAELMARVAQEEKDVPAAKRYYQTALNRLDKTKPTYPSRLQQLKREQAALTP
jgi:tetratricopeptide (TPR) repeat protein